MNERITAAMSMCVCMCVVWSNETLYFTAILNLHKVLHVVYTTEILLQMKHF